MQKAKEIKVFDANAMKSRLTCHIISARYQGIDDVPMGYESSNIAEFLRGYERGAIDTANIALGQKLVDAVEVFGVRIAGTHTTELQALCAADPDR